MSVASVQRAAAENILKQLQAHQDAWQRVDVILEHSQNQQTKFLAMQASRWRSCTVDEAAVSMLRLCSADASNGSMWNTAI